MRRFSGARPGLLLPVAVILVGALGLHYLTPAPPPIEGRATAVDGDTLRLGGERIRLVGLDAPERDQTCTDANGAEWPCGEAARQRMAALVADGGLSCAPRGRDRYDRLLAVCTMGTKDVAAAMVTEGLAVAQGGYFGEQADAQKARRGIWAGTFVPPAAYRHEQTGNGQDQNIIDIVRSWFR